MKTLDSCTVRAQSVPKRITVLVELVRVRAQRLAGLEVGLERSLLMLGQQPSILCDSVNVVWLRDQHKRHVVSSAAFGPTILT
jgi:hypothetical protein